MDLMFWLNIVFGAVTVGSFIIAIHENKEKARAIAAEEKWKNMYKTNCQAKCITIAGIAREFASNISLACKTVKQCENVNKNSESLHCCDQLINLAGSIHSTQTSTNSLIDFCKVLQKEFENNFNEQILVNFYEEVPHRLCN